MARPGTPIRSNRRLEMSVGLFGLAYGRTGRATHRGPDRTSHHSARDGARGGALFNGLTAGREGHGGKNKSGDGQTTHGRLLNKGIDEGKRRRSAVVPVGTAMAVGAKLLRRNNGLRIDPIPAIFSTIKARFPEPRLFAELRSARDWMWRFARPVPTRDDPRGRHFPPCHTGLSLCSTRLPQAPTRALIMWPESGP
jgi:hypothetical protein